MCPALLFIFSMNAHILGDYPAPSEPFSLLYFLLCISVPFPFSAIAHLCKMSSSVFGYVPFAPYFLFSLKGKKELN